MIGNFNSSMNLELEFQNTWIQKIYTKYLEISNILVIFAKKIQGKFFLKVNINSPSLNVSTTIGDLVFN